MFAVPNKQFQNMAELPLTWDFTLIQVDLWSEDTTEHSLLEAMK